ncbi:MAG: hypothetical protein WC757_04315 [Candidatus Paceibacterota bacterium]|jgi:hypothetical protein
MKIVNLILLFWLSTNTFSKPVIHTTQQLINRAAMNTDTIFIGKVLEKKEIDNGFILDNGHLPVGILKIEVLKVYRGMVKKTEQKFICTWFDKTEHEFTFEIGQELTFFGVETGINIQLPSTLGFVFASTGLEDKFSKALKLPINIRKNKNLIFEIVEPDDVVSRNACNEQDFWKN